MSVVAAASATSSALPPDARAASQRGGVRRGEGGSHAPKPSSNTVRAGAASLPTSLIGSAASV